MIACFPDLYPDELFYSGCARYSDRVQYPGRTLCGELFGSTTLSPVLHFPGHLDTFIDALPSDHYLTADIIINEHTFLPFFSPFVPSERVDKVRTAMRRGKTSGVPLRLGVHRKHIEWPKNLRFCVQCVDEDRNQLGEAYWHRIHQIPGIDVCSKHGIYLSLSEVISREIPYHANFISAEQAIKYNPFTSIDRQNVSFEVLQQIARDVYFLLNHPILSGLETIKKKYMVLLKQKRLAGHQGRLRSKQLLQEFRHHFSKQTLSHLKCDLDIGKSENWLLSTISPLLSL